jgi:hypothetical protein
MPNNLSIQEVYDNLRKETNINIPQDVKDILMKQILISEYITKLSGDIKQLNSNLQSELVNMATSKKSMKDISIDYKNAILNLLRKHGAIDPPPALDTTKLQELINSLTAQLAVATNTKANPVDQSTINTTINNINGVLANNMQTALTDEQQKSEKCDKDLQDTTTKLSASEQKEQRCQAERITDKNAHQIALKAEQDAVAQLIVDNSNLEAQIVALTAKITAGTGTSADQAMINQLIIDKDKCNQDLTRANTRVTQLVKDLTAETDKVGTCNTDLKAAQANVTVLEQQVTAKQAEITKKQSEYTALTAENKKIQQALDQLIKANPGSTRIPLLDKKKQELNNKIVKIQLALNAMTRENEKNKKLIKDGTQYVLYLETKLKAVPTPTTVRRDLKDDYKKIQKEKLDLFRLHFAINQALYGHHF